MTQDLTWDSSLEGLWLELFSIFGAYKQTLFLFLVHLHWGNVRWAPECPYFQCTQPQMTDEIFVIKPITTRHLASFISQKFAPSWMMRWGFAEYFEKMSELGVQIIKHKQYVWAISSQMYPQCILGLFTLKSCLPVIGLLSMGLNGAFEIQLAVPWWKIKGENDPL